MYSLLQSLLKDKVLGSILFGILILLLVIIIVMASANTPFAGSLPIQYENSAWVWESPADISEEEFLGWVNYAKEKNIRTLYLFMEEYLDIIDSTLPESSERVSQIEELNTHIQRLISIASAKDVEVHALAGNVDWAEPELTYLPKILMQFVLEFNDRNDVHFAGIQFDIEFYNQKEFKKNKDEFTLNYLKLVADLSDMAEDKVQLGLAIPHGLDGSRSSIPEVKFENKKGSVLEHLLEILPNKSYLALMAYRNYAFGNNGTVEISQPTLELVSGSDKDVRVYVGMEMVENELGHITFHSKSQKEVNSVAKQISEAFSHEKSFAGLAIHTLSAYLKLR